MLVLSKLCSWLGRAAPATTFQTLAAAWRVLTQHEQLKAWTEVAQVSSKSF